MGTRTLVERYWGATGELIDMSSPGGCHCDTKTWLHPTAYKLQFWDTSGQTAKRVRTQPHPSTDRMPKLFLSSKPHLNKPFDMTLPTRGTRSISTHQWAGTSLSYQAGACISILEQTYSPGGRHSKQKELESCSLCHKDHKHKVRQNEKTEEHISDRGTR